MPLWLLGRVHPLSNSCKLFRLFPWLDLLQAIFFRTAWATDEGTLQMCFACVAARTCDGHCGLCLFGLFAQVTPLDFKDL